MYTEKSPEVNKSGAVVKQQRTLVVLKTTSDIKGLFKSSTVSLYRSLVTSLVQYNACTIFADLPMQS